MLIYPLRQRDVDESDHPRGWNRNSVRAEGAGCRCDYWIESITWVIFPAGYDIIFETVCYLCQHSNPLIYFLHIDCEILKSVSSGHSLWDCSWIDKDDNIMRIAELVAPSECICKGGCAWGVCTGYLWCIPRLPHDQRYIYDQLPKYCLLVTHD